MHFISKKFDAMKDRREATVRGKWPQEVQGESNIPSQAPSSRTESQKC